MNKLRCYLLLLLAWFIFQETVPASACSPPSGDPWFNITNLTLDQDALPQTIRVVLRDDHTLIITTHDMGTKPVEVLRQDGTSVEVRNGEQRLTIEPWNLPDFLWDFSDPQHYEDNRPEKISVPVPHTGNLRIKDDTNLYTVVATISYSLNQSYRPHETQDFIRMCATALATDQAQDISLQQATATSPSLTNAPRILPRSSISVLEGWSLLLLAFMLFVGILWLSLFNRRR